MKFFFSAQMPCCMHDVNSSHLNWKEKNMRRVCNNKYMSMWRRCGMRCGDARFARQWASTQHMIACVAMFLFRFFFLLVFFLVVRFSLWWYDCVSMVTLWREGRRLFAYYAPECRYIFNGSRWYYLTQCININSISNVIAPEHFFSSFLRARVFLKLFVCVHVCLVEGVLVCACVRVCVCVFQTNNITDARRKSKKKKQKTKLKTTKTTNERIPVTDLTYIHK